MNIHHTKTTALSGAHKASMRLIAASLNGDRSFFAARVKELSRTGAKDAFSTAAMKYPEEYNRWRSQKESQTGGYK